MRWGVCSYYGLSAPAPVSILEQATTLTSEWAAFRALELAKLAAIHRNRKEHSNSLKLSDRLLIKMCAILVQMDERGETIVKHTLSAATKNTGLPKDHMQCYYILRALHEIGVLYLRSDPKKSPRDKLYGRSPQYLLDKTQLAEYLAKWGPPTR